jgi:hypothetical protein
MVLMVEDNMGSTIGIGNGFNQTIATSHNSLHHRDKDDERR